MLEAINLRKEYNNFCGLNSLNIKVEAGVIYCPIVFLYTFKVPDTLLYINFHLFQLIRSIVSVFFILKI